MKRYLFPIILLFLLACGEDDAATEVVEEEPEADSTAYFDSAYAELRFRLDTFFKNRMDETTFNGNILFAERGRIIFDNFYGYARFKPEDTLTIDHTFQLASASKPFTAVGILLLVQAGELDLASNVKTFIPEFPYEGITVEMLLTHRSGLSDYHYFCDAPDSIWPDKHVTIDNEDAICIMGEIVPMYYYLPDTQFDYCNTNYMLLASIIERITGQTFEDYMRVNVFEPCGMENTMIYNRHNKEELTNACIGYNGAWNPCMDIYLNGCVGDKGVYSTVHDMFKFDRALYHGELIDPELLVAMQAPHSDNSKGSSYGYGWRLKWLDDDTKIVYHTGWWKGFRSYFVRVPERDWTIIVLDNVKRGSFLQVEELVALMER